MSIQQIFGPLESLFEAVIGAWAMWHHDATVSPEQLAADASNIATGVGQVMKGGEAIYQEILNQLLEKHPTLAPNHARVVAAVAAESVKA